MSASRSAWMVWRLSARAGPSLRHAAAVFRVPSRAAGAASGRNDSWAPNTSLFVPLKLNPEGSGAGDDVGAELTRSLDKSKRRRGGMGRAPPRGEGGDQARSRARALAWAAFHLTI